MTARAAPSPHLLSTGESRAVTLQITALTDAESKQLLHYLAGLSPQAVDMAIIAIKAMQLHQEAAHGSPSPSKVAG
jgi:hypothetical protein